MHLYSLECLLSRINYTDESNYIILCPSVSMHQRIRPYYICSAEHCQTHYIQQQYYMHHRLEQAQYLEPKWEILKPHLATLNNSVLKLPQSQFSLPDRIIGNGWILKALNIQTRYRRNFISSLWNEAVPTALGQNFTKATSKLKTSRWAVKFMSAKPWRWKCENDI